MANKRYRIVAELNMDPNNIKKLVVTAKSMDQAKYRAESIVKKDPNTVYFKINSCDEITEEYTTST